MMKKRLNPILKRNLNELKFRADYIRLLSREEFAGMCYFEQAKQLLSVIKEPG